MIDLSERLDMNKQEENINTNELKEEQPKQRQWYRLRGWTDKFLEDLQYSGGKTTREISDATNCKVTVAAVILQRLRQYNVIERIAGWGWKITSDGISYLLSKNNTNNINYINSLLINNKQNNNNKQQENIEKPPSCFTKTYCHIRKLLKQTVYNSKNAFVCDGCVMGNSNEYPKNFIGRQAVRISI
jgi:ribosomal protein S19E (S16A)